MQQNKRLNKIILIVSMGVTSSAYAATAVSPSPNNLPINVTSSSATVDLKQGVAVYNGNVVATQGVRKLTGDTLTVTRGNNGKIQSFMAAGNPAKTQDLPSPNGEMAYGQAQNIYYLPEQSLVKYVKNAKFTQGGNVFTGDLITYNTQTQVVSSPKVPGGSGTTTIILPAYDQGNKGS